MRLFPFLTKVPKYKRFNFEPRYYDAAREEREQRVAQIEREMQRERLHGQQGDVSELQSGSLRPGSIRGSRPERQPVLDSSAINRFLLVIILGGSVYGYIEYGELALIVGGAGFLIYLFLRIRKGA